MSGHGAFKSIYYEDNPVYHFQDTFHFPAEVGMAWGVDNIDFCIFIDDGGILGKDSYPPFPLYVVRIHDPFRHFLIGPEDTALL